MHDRQPASETKSHRSQQTKERQPQGTKAPEDTLITQQDPLTQVISPMSNVPFPSAHATRLNRLTASSPSLTQGTLLQLQRQYGNRYVQRVMNIARQGQGNAEVAPEVEATIQRKRGGGQALDSTVQVQMESAFGTDFSGVRVHADGEADGLNRALSARAFTTGQDIFFRQGEYAPGSSRGKELLAHELTHVVQQRDGMQYKLAVGQPGDRYEQEADRVAKKVMEMSPSLLQKQSPSEEEEEESVQIPQSQTPKEEEEKIVQTKIINQPALTASLNLKNCFSCQLVPVSQQSQIPHIQLNIKANNSVDLTSNFDRKGILTSSSGSTQASSQYLRNQTVTNTPLDDGFQNMGRVATVRFGESSSSLRADGYPRIFVDGGRTGKAAYTDAPSQGTRCNQLAGSYQRIIVPAYDSRSLGIFRDSEAWVRRGTGNLTVERSYVGVDAGDQGNGYYVTPRAAARANQHEALHIQNSRRLYNTHLRPLLARVRRYTPAPSGGGHVVTRYFQGAARQELQRIIGWTSAIWSFRNSDIAVNGVGGTIDRAYLASPTRLFDAGSGRVGGTAYQHRIHIGTEPEPR